MLSRSSIPQKIEHAMHFSSSSSSSSSSPSLSLTSHQIPPTHHLHPQESSVLTTLESCKSTKQLKQIHAFILKTKPLQTQLVYSKLISSSLSKNLHYGRSIFEHLQNPEVNVYNAIIRALSSSKNTALEAVGIYRELLANGLVPDNYTIPFVLKACSQSGALREGQEVHSYVVKTGLVSDVYVKNTLMRMYAVCGLIRDVRKVFDESPQRDLVSWTTLIQGYVKMGFPRNGVRAFFDMCEENLRADEMTLVIVLSACARLGDLSLGRKIHKYMHDNKVNSDVFVGNALVDMYLKCGDADCAREVFNEMVEKNVVSWNSMISGLAQQGEFKEALDVFREMQIVGIKPDDVTLVGVLNSCANLGVLELGKWVHTYIDRHRIQPDGYIGNALVDMYAKCGSIDKAYGVFQAMKFRDVYSYTAMIVGLAMHGQGEKALELFSEMPKVGVEPDGVTFVGVLAACSHVGLLDEGRKHFQDMSRVYNLSPQTEHYGCMVDLLGRAGLVYEAVEFIRDMPIKPDALVLGALLGACSIHGKVELAQSVLKELIEIEPEKDGAYILMSNIYSSANRWREAVKLRKAMKERKLKKIPGCSSIELDGMVHEFRKGDKSHRKTKDIYALLHEIANHSKNLVDLLD